MIVAITNRGIFRLLSSISSSTLRIALQESNILENEKFSTPQNSACSYTFRGMQRNAFFVGCTLVFMITMAACVQSGA